jgi:hypothetical protein
MRTILVLAFCIAASGAAVLDALANGKERQVIYQNGVFGVLVAGVCSALVLSIW